MRKNRLMTPGPTPVLPEAAGAMALPHPHHRTPQFKELVGRLRANLKQVFRSEGEMVLLTSSGTGAMEAALTSLTRPGDPVVVVDSGKFGHRWVDLCEAFGRQPHLIQPPPRRAVAAEEIEQAVAGQPGATALFLAACESSTGVRADVRAVAAAARRAAGRDLLIIVDAITEVGAAPLESTAWDLDVVIGGSQKAFMVPPGLAMMALSARACARLEGGGGGLYFNLAVELAAQQGNSTAWTPATALAYALDTAVSQMLEQGMETIWNEVDRMARMTREAVAAMGLSLFAETPAVSLTAVESPTGLDSGRLVAALEADFGIRIAGGQGDLKGKIFRLAHLGHIDPVDTLGTLGALGISLARLGAKVDIPAGLVAAVSVMAER